MQTLYNLLKKKTTQFKMGKKSVERGRGQCLDLNWLYKNHCAHMCAIKYVQINKIVAIALPAIKLLKSHTFLYLYTQPDIKLF